MTISQSLKAMIQAHHYDKTVYVRDYSIGDINEREICFTSQECRFVQPEEEISHTYENYGTYTFLYRVKDEYANISNTTVTFTLEEPNRNNPVYLMSIPKATINDQ